VYFSFDKAAPLDLPLDHRRIAPAGLTDEDLDALLRDPEALGGDGPVEGEDDIPDPWPRELVDHGYFYRKDRKAAAVAAHLYGTFDAAKCQDAEATAALYGLRVTWPEDFPSWYLPGRTTLMVCTPLAEPAR